MTNPKYVSPTPSSTLVLKHQRHLVYSEGSVHLRLESFLRIINREAYKSNVYGLHNKSYGLLSIRVPNKKVGLCLRNLSKVKVQTVRQSFERNFNSPLLDGFTNLSTIENKNRSLNGGEVPICPNLTTHSNMLHTKQQFINRDRFLLYRTLC